MDPGSVLELVQITETAMLDEKVETVQQVIAELGDCHRRAAAMKLLIRAKQIAGVTIL